MTRSARLRAGLEHGRGAPRRGLDRVRTRLSLIAQTALAAGAAWELASLVHPRPFFAPIAAVIALGVTRGQHLRRAVEISFGVAVGILVADLLVALLGSSGLTMVLVAAAAMTAALLLGAGVLLVNQAAISGVLIVALETPPDVTSFDRFFDALIGCGLAVVIGPLLFGRDPLRQVGRAADRVLARLAEALEAIAAALAEGDQAAASHALELARDTDAEVDAFVDTLAAAEEAIRLSPPRRRRLPHFVLYSEASRQVDYAVRNTRVLARAAETALARGVPAEAELCDAIRLLAQAVRALGEDLREPDGASEAGRLARQAAAEATAVLDRRSDLSSNVMVAQIRSTAADLLRGSGMDTQEMRAALEPFPGAEGQA